MAIQALRFLTQPVSTVYNLYHSEATQKKIERDNIAFSTLAPFYGKALPSDVEAKIKNFILSELKIDPEKLIFRVISDMQGPVGVQGSIHLDRGIVCFSPEFVAELGIELKASHKFGIAHELGHLEHDDNCKGRFEKQKASQLAGLGAYSIIALASPFTSAGFIGIHLLGCTVAKCTELYTRRKIQLQYELRADLYAAKQSPEIASGGIDTVHQLQQHNLEVKRRWLSTPAGFLTTLKKAALDILLTPNGDIRFIDDHPLGQIRIDQITPYLLSSSNA
jgi:hypothetical protein